MAGKFKGDGALYQRPDGLWCGQVDLGFIDGKRKRKTVYDRNYERAYKKVEEARRARDAGLLDTTSPTVEKWLRRWLDDVAAKKVKPRTLLTYRTYVERYLIPALGKKRIDRLTVVHLAELDRLMDGKSSTTRLHAYRVLGNALEVARKRRMIQWNIVSEVEEMPRKREPTRQGLTGAQARAVLKSAGDERNASRWWAALLTGARQGELLGLRWEHVDLDAGTIDLAWSLQRVPYTHSCGSRSGETWPCGKKRGASCPQRRCFVPEGMACEHLEGNLYLMRPKTVGSIRVVPLLPAMVAALRLHRDRTAAEPNPYGLVWHDEDGSPQDGRRDWKAWRDLLAAAGAPPVTLHEARNTTATLLLEAGHDPHVIASILGHSNIVTTRGYQKVSLELARRAVTSLGETLGLPAA